MPVHPWEALLNLDCVNIPGEVIEKGKDLAKEIRRRTAGVEAADIVLRHIFRDLEEEGCVCWKRLETIQFEPIKLEGKQEAMGVGLRLEGYEAAKELRQRTNGIVVVEREGAYYIEISRGIGDDRILPCHTWQEFIGRFKDWCFRTYGMNQFQLMEQAVKNALGGSLNGVQKLYDFQHKSGLCVKKLKQQMYFCTGPLCRGKRNEHFDKCRGAWCWTLGAKERNPSLGEWGFMGERVKFMCLRDSHPMTIPAHPMESCVQKAEVWAHQVGRLASQFREVLEEALFRSHFMELEFDAVQSDEPQKIAPWPSSQPCAPLHPTSLAAEAPWASSSSPWHPTQEPYETGQVQPLSMTQIQDAHYEADLLGRVGPPSALDDFSSLGSLGVNPMPIFADSPHLSIFPPRGPPPPGICGGGVDSLDALPGMHKIPGMPPSMPPSMPSMLGGGASLPHELMTSPSRHMHPDDGMSGMSGMPMSSLLLNGFDAPLQPPPTVHGAGLGSRPPGNLGYNLQQPPTHVPPSAFDAGRLPLGLERSPASASAFDAGRLSPPGMLPRSPTTASAPGAPARFGALAPAAPRGLGKGAGAPAGPGPTGMEALEDVSLLLGLSQELRAQLLDLDPKLSGKHDTRDKKRKNKEMRHNIIDSAYSAVPEANKIRLFQRVKTQAVALSVHELGGLVVTSIFRQGTERQMHELVTVLAPEVVNLAKNSEGTRVVQAAVENVRKADRQLLLEALMEESKIMQVIGNPNAVFLIRSCLSLVVKGQMPPEWVNPIIKTVKGRIKEIVDNKKTLQFSYKLILWVVECGHCVQAFKEAKSRILGFCSQTAKSLIDTKYGNILLRYALQLGSAEHQERIFEVALESLREVHDKRWYASHVIDMCADLVKEDRVKEDLCSKFMQTVIRNLQDANGQEESPFQRMFRSSNGKRTARRVYECVAEEYQAIMRKQVPGIENEELVKGAASFDSTLFKNDDGDGADEDGHDAD